MYCILCPSIFFFFKYSCYSLIILLRVYIPILVHCNLFCSSLLSCISLVYVLFLVELVSWISLADPAVSYGCCCRRNCSCSYVAPAVTVLLLLLTPFTAVLLLFFFRCYSCNTLIPAVYVNLTLAVTFVTVEAPATAAAVNPLMSLFLVFL